jgi:hypothetical protein
LTVITMRTRIIQTISGLIIDVAPVFAGSLISYSIALVGVSQGVSIQGGSVTLNSFILVVINQGAPALFLGGSALFTGDFDRIFSQDACILMLNGEAVIHTKTMNSFQTISPAIDLQGGQMRLQVDLISSESGCIQVTGGSHKLTVMQMSTNGQTVPAVRVANNGILFMNFQEITGSVNGLITVESGGNLNMIGDRISTNDNGSGLKTALLIMDGQVDANINVISAFGSCIHLSSGGGNPNLRCYVDAISSTVSTDPLFAGTSVILQETGNANIRFNRMDAFYSSQMIRVINGNIEVEGELMFNTFAPSTGIVVSGGTFVGNINRIGMGTRALEASLGSVTITFVEISVFQPSSERIIVALSGNATARIVGDLIQGGTDYSGIIVSDTAFLEAHINEMRVGGTCLQYNSTASSNFFFDVLTVAGGVTLPDTAAIVMSTGTLQVKGSRIENQTGLITGFGILLANDANFIGDIDYIRSSNNGLRTSSTGRVQLYADEVESLDLEAIQINNLPFGNSADYTFKGLYRTFGPLTSTVIIDSPAPPNVLRFINTTLISNVPPSMISTVPVLVKNYGILTSTFSEDATVSFIFPSSVNIDPAVN